ncbi:MAG: type II toxin-antitoxin system VapC family toxin [Desulfatitalea sp.]|nr:type II toxin-antitoxin system VapC family toxin [Desulfatitalea sp.]NNJ99234.1 type II toxin-antitoxin system VapC family toxin [Desulfatitalea sp.]
MIKYLLDTNVVSEAIKKSPNQSVMHHFARYQQEIATASPVWHELQYGCTRLPASKKRTLIEAYLSEVVWNNLTILPYDEKAANWHAVQRARLELNGKSTSFVDGQIAGIAATNGLTLVTRNISDFASFSDLILENWHME